MFAQYAEDVIEQGERPRGDGCVLNDGADLQRIAQQQVGRHAECIGNADERLEAAALLPALDVPDVGGRNVDLFGERFLGELEHFPLLADSKAESNIIYHLFCTLCNKIAIKLTKPHQ